jgi:hypothetical protein
VSVQVTYEAGPGLFREYAALPLIGGDLEGLTPRVDGQTDAIANKRIRMECSLCGFNLTRRGHKLAPVLDRLADASVAEITVRGLARLT